ncbi:Protocadherin-16 [Dirofilaria immitis]
MRSLFLNSVFSPITVQFNYLRQLFEISYRRVDPAIRVSCHYPPSANQDRVANFVYFLTLEMTNPNAPQFLQKYYAFVRIGRRIDLILLTAELADQ